MDVAILFTRSTSCRRSSGDGHSLSWRGVVHFGFANTLEGTEIPRGGNASVMEHVFGGNTEGEFTSWAADFSTTEGFASLDRPRVIETSKGYIAVWLDNQELPLGMLIFGRTPGGQDKASVVRALSRWLRDCLN